MKLIMDRVHIELVKEARSVPYFGFLFCPKAGPRAPGETVKSDLGNRQPLSLSKKACFTLPSLASTRKRLDVMPNRLAALLADIKIRGCLRGSPRTIVKNCMCLL